jgi:hypothetical protein
MPTTTDTPAMNSHPPLHLRAGREWKPGGSLTAPDLRLSRHANYSQWAVLPAYARIRPAQAHTCSCLVMKGSAVRVRASALSSWLVGFGLPFANPPHHAGIQPFRGGWGF